MDALFFMSGLEQNQIGKERCLTPPRYFPIPTGE